MSDGVEQPPSNRRGKLKFKAQDGAVMGHHSDEQLTSQTSLLLQHDPAPNDLYAGTLSLQHSVLFFSSPTLR